MGLSITEAPTRIRSFFSKSPPVPPQKPPLPDEIRDSIIAITPLAQEVMARRAGSDEVAYGIHPEARYLQDHKDVTLRELAEGTGKPERALLGEVTALTGVFTLTQPHGEVSLPPPPTNGHTQRP